MNEDLQAPELDQPVLELQAGQEAATVRQQQAGTAGGAVTPITSGGTGSSTAAGALANLGAAPSNATYITQTASAGLSAEQALAALATGYVKVTITTGVLSSQPVPIPVADGGTGAITIAGILTALGIGKQNSTNVAPTVNDDNTQGYSINSLWTDTTGPTSYICQSVATGAAVWHAIP